jgi:hypothetical protein
MDAESLEAIAAVAAILGVDQLLRYRSRRLNDQDRCGSCGVLLTPEDTGEIRIGLIAKRSYETAAACNRCAARVVSNFTIALVVVTVAVVVALTWLNR